MRPRCGRSRRDRPRTLALLREARDHDPRDLTNEFRTSAFEDVQDDPEFLQAISRGGFESAILRTDKSQMTLRFVWCVGSAVVFSALVSSPCSHATKWKVLSVSSEWLVQIAESIGNCL